MEADWIHRAGDYVPLAAFIGGLVAWITREQTKKIKAVFNESVAEHNKNGVAHVALSQALRAERGELFQRIGEQINEQNVQLGRIEERLDGLYEEHKRLTGGGTRSCTPDPNYSGPFRRSSDRGRS